MVIMVKDASGLTKTEPEFTSEGDKTSYVRMLSKFDIS